jgi:hypothetical protein
LSYELGILEEKGISTIKKLSKEEYREYKTAAERLFDFSRDQQLYAIVSFNFDDFKELIKKYAEDYSKNPQNINYILLENMILNINRHILNFLASVKCFLDHNETKIKKKFGKKSKRVSYFKEMCSEIYDVNFSYRFLTKLRNYTQHCGMPLGGLKLHSKEDPPFSNIVHHSLQVNFSRDQLLEYDSWGPQISKELQKFPPEFDVVPHIDEMMKCIKRINTSLISLDIAELYRCVDLIENIIKPALEKEGIPCILRIPLVNRDTNKKITGLKLEISHIPFHIIDSLNKARKLKRSNLKHIQQKRGNERQNIEQ